MTAIARDFDTYFSQWAPHYDDTVRNPQGIFAEVFCNYGEILTQVTRQLGPSPRRVADVGAGTGNLSLCCHLAGHKVVSVEPCAEMRELARAKLPSEVEILDGDLLNLPLPTASVDAIVSTWVLHHLPDHLKREAIKELTRVLRAEGKIVMADTVFVSESAREDILQKLSWDGKEDWRSELEAEYYTTLEVLTDIFARVGYTASFRRMNKWVWLWEAKPLLTSSMPMGGNSNMAIEGIIK